MKCKTEVSRSRGKRSSHLHVMRRTRKLSGLRSGADKCSLASYTDKERFLNSVHIVARQPNPRLRSTFCKIRQVVVCSVPRNAVKTLNGTLEGKNTNRVHRKLKYDFSLRKYLHIAVHMQQGTHSFASESDRFAHNQFLHTMSVITK